MATAETTEVAKPRKAPAKKPTSTKSAAPRKRAANSAVKVETPRSKDYAAHADRIWDLAKKIGIAMFVTWDGERQRARPLAATVDKDEHAIYFLTDSHGHKDDEAAKFPTVTLAFADPKHNKFVTITGKAEVSDDREKIRDLWSPFAKAWWDSPDDPAIRVIKVTPEDAELWDSPGRVVSTVVMLASALTRSSPKLGENAKVTM